MRVVEAEVADLHDEMTAAAGERNLWVVGGGNVASQFADAGLLDEVLLTVVPVVLGEGKPLFDRPPPGGPMQLTGSRAFESGMVELSYEITGRTTRARRGRALVSARVRLSGGYLPPFSSSPPWSVSLPTTLKSRSSWTSVWLPSSRVTSTS